MKRDELRFGEALRLVRTVMNVRQSDFAKWLNISPVSLSNLEKNGNPSMETVIRLYYVLQQILESKISNDEIGSIQRYVVNEVENDIVYPLIQDILFPKLEENVI